MSDCIRTPLYESMNVASELIPRDVPRDLCIVPLGTVYCATLSVLINTPNLLNVYLLW